MENQNTNSNRYEEIKSNADRIGADILTLTRNGLFMSLRFLDVALCQFDFQSSEDIPGLSTTGQTLIYNTKYVITKYLHEKQVLSRDYLHMVLHCIFRHPFVSDKLNRNYWDLSVDIAVEAIIRDLDLKQAETDDSDKINSELDKLADKIGRLTAERIYNFIRGGGLTDREIARLAPIFLRDDHEIWWELARKLKEQAEAEAEAESESSSEGASDERPEAGDEQSEEEQVPEEEDTPEEDESEQGSDDETAEDDEGADDQEEPSETEEDESSEDGEDQGEENNITDPNENADEAEDDDEPDDTFQTGGDQTMENPDGEDGGAEEDPDGVPDDKDRDGDGTTDVNDGNFGENADADSEQDSSGRTGKGENEGEEDASGPDEGGSMQQGAGEPNISDMPGEKQDGSRRSHGNSKKNAAKQTDQSKSGGESGGDGIQAAFQHQTSGGEKKGTGGGSDVEDREELKGEHKSAASGGENAPDPGDEGMSSRKSSSPEGDEETKYDQAKLDELEKKWREISERLMVDLETSSKEWGDKSDVMLQGLKNINKDKYDYESFLKKFAVFREDIQINPDEFDYVYYTYGLQRYGNMPLIEPLEYREVKKIHEFVIAIDTSGSCSGEVVQKFLDKTYSILQKQESFFRKINVHIIQCDAEIQEVAKITSKEDFDEYLKSLTFKGFGGTDFRPVFEYVNSMIEQGEFKDLKGLIYFTDGNGTYPLKRPKYETAFVFVDDDEFEYEVPSWAIRLVLETTDILEEDKVKVNL